MIKNLKVKNMILGMNKEGNVLEEAKRDFEIERNKNATIEGYRVIRYILNVIPEKYQKLLYLDEIDNSLWFDSFRLGKITEIGYIVENYHLDMGLSTEIIIERAKEEPARIEFKHCRNKQTNKYDYIDFSVAVGY